MYDNSVTGPKFIFVQYNVTSWEVQINCVNSTGKPVFKILQKQLFFKCLQAFSTHVFVFTETSI